MSEYTKLALLVSVLLIGIANLLGTFGWIGNGPDEYRVVTSAEMDKLGFKGLAEKNGVVIHSKGTQPASVAEDEIRVSFVDKNQEVVIDYPGEMAKDLLKTRILPFTIQQIEKEGWSFVSVTSDNHYIFRK